MLNIKTNSKLVKKGDTFVAIKGNTVDGHDFIDEAVKNGATKIVSEKVNSNLETILVKDTKKYLNDYLVNNYSDKFKYIKFIGITGTNGKTTTAYLTSQILTKLGVKCAYVGTIGYYVDSKFVKVLNNTTPDILELYNLILDAKENGVKVIVMEVSSHSLDMGRINGIKLDVAAFTNLTEDHLDYHKTMKNYLNSKLLILNYMKENGVMISNIDDLYGKYFVYKNTKTIGFSVSDYQILNYKYDKTGTNIEFKSDKVYNVKTNLLYIIIC